MADSKAKKKDESTSRRVGPKNSVTLPVLRRLPMPHADLIRRPEGETATALSPADNVEPTSNAGPSHKTGPADNAVVALHGAGPSLSAGPVAAAGPKREFSLLDSLPDVKGYMIWFHQVTDYLDRQLTPFEQCLYKQLYRLSWGFDSPTCIIGFPKLAERTNMSETAARQAAKGLVKKGLVKKQGMVFGKGVEQGIEWEIYAPSALIKHKEETSRRPARNAGPSFNTGQVLNAGPVPAAPIKEINTQNKNTQTQAGGVSRFTFDECRTYAEHLKKTGGGITNPRGFATVIHRTGQADNDIEAFLHPASEKAASCARCVTTGGFIYIDPSNPDKGVRPCKHESL
jgi:hypothetical protein